jgi:ankyrin repeat protein
MLDYLFFSIKECNANIDITNSGGETALFGAVRSRYYDVVDILLRYGENPMIRNFYDNTTLLYFAAKAGDESILRLLVPYCVVPRTGNSDIAFLQNEFTKAGRNDWLNFISCVRIIKDEGKNALLH